VFVWLLGCLSAHAGTAQLKVLVMPLTPFDEYREEFHALIPAKGETNMEWASDHAGFECIGNGDFVEVWVRKQSWPSFVPKKVVCSNGSESLKAKIRIFDTHLESMFVADGTLVMPREKKHSALFSGPLPLEDIGVQQGKTGGLTVQCKVEPGSVLKVTVQPSHPDGDGRCSFQTKHGEKVYFPIRIRSIKRSF